MVVNWILLGHQRQAAVSGKGHKHWGLSLCRVAQHTSNNLQRAFTYLRRLENLKAETRQGGQRNAQCFTLVKPWHVMIISFLEVCPPHM